MKQFLEDYFYIDITINSKLPNIILNELDYVTDIHCKVVHEPIEDSETVVATVEIKMIDFNRAEKDGFDIVELLDSIDDDMESFSEFYDTVCDNYNGLFIINRIEVVNKYRGFGFPDKILAKLNNIFFNKINIIGLKSFPLQHINNCTNTFEEDSLKLISYYRSIGFTRFNNTEIMYKPI
jgi:hypothetical protein